MSAGRIEGRELRDRLRLCRSANVGPVTYRELLSRFGDGQSAMEAAVTLSSRGGRPIRLASEEAIQGEMEATEQLGAVQVALGDERYPEMLAAIDGAPPVLSVLGDVDRLGAASIAIVGSRNASAAGRRLAQDLAATIGAAGYPIVSGLARGIDTAAHQGGLATGTVAVLAGGLDRIYPAENLGLAEDIVNKGGALATEMPIGLAARGKDFPRRNRIISGLSLGVVVVEAARRSGSLYTARRAAEQGRSVFAVPGSPLDPRAEGTNMLIREGATLAASASDVLDDVTPMTAPAPHPPASPIVFEEAQPVETTDDARVCLLEALSPSPVSVDDLIRLTGLSHGEIQLVLLELSLAGRIERHAGQRVSLSS